MHFGYLLEFTAWSLTQTYLLRNLLLNFNERLVFKRSILRFRFWDSTIESLLRVFILLRRWHVLITWLRLYLERSNYILIKIVIRALAILMINLLIHRPQKMVWRTKDVALFHNLFLVLLYFKLALFVRTSFMLLIVLPCLKELLLKLSLVINTKIMLHQLELLFVINYSRICLLYVIQIVLDHVLTLIVGASSNHLIIT